MTELNGVHIRPETRHRIRETWPQLTEDDLEQVGDNYEDLIDLIHCKTGGLVVSIRATMRILVGETERSREWDSYDWQIVHHALPETGRTAGKPEGETSGARTNQL